MSTNAPLQSVLAQQAYRHVGNAERLIDVELRLPFLVKLDAEHIAAAGIGGFLEATTSPALPPYLAKDVSAFQGHLSMFRSEIRAAFLRIAEARQKGGVR